MQTEILTFLYSNWPNIIIILVISLVIWISYKKGLIKKYFWAYIIVLLIFVFSLYLVNLELSYNSGGREYLLSAVSQVLGTAFALVFTITIISAELSSKYSQRMLGRVFTRWTIFYMFIFIVSIVFPLVALVNISDVAVKVSLILCALCLLFLIPYSLTIKERTSPKKLLEELYEKSVENLSKYDELPNELEIIDNVIMSSYSFKDYETFEIGIEKLGLIGIKPNKISAVPIVSKIFGKIRDIGLATIDDSRQIV